MNTLAGPVARRSCFSPSVAGWQRTLAGPVEVTGVGLHSGRPVRVVVAPAAPDFGVQFGGVPARVEFVSDTRLGTTLTCDGRRVRTVEHWLAAFAGLGLDNVAVAMPVGDELPAMDGSAAPIVARLQDVGFVVQPRRRRAWIVRAPVEVRRPDGAFARLEPAPGLEASARLVGRYVFRPPVGEQAVRIELTPETFARAVAPARTFAFAEDVAAMQAADRALGGSLANAVLFAADGPQNPEGLRFFDECARHKLLDAVGDLALFGAPWVGRYVSERGGHALNVALVREALATPGALQR